MPFRFSSIPINMNNKIFLSHMLKVLSSTTCKLYAYCPLPPSCCGLQCKLQNVHLLLPSLHSVPSFDCVANIRIPCLCFLVTIGTTTSQVHTQDIWVLNLLSNGCS